MELKYFLRGAGAGFIIASLICLVAFLFYKPTLSDDEVIKRAGELGMVKEEKDTASGSGQGTEEKDTEDQTKEADGQDKDQTKEADGQDKAKDKKAEGTTVTKVSDDGKTTVTKKTGEDVTSPPSPGTAGKVHISIARGEDSLGVGQDLYAHGLVDDPKKFDSYLGEQKLDGRIQAGNFSIPKGASYQEIARIITGK